MKCVGVNCEWLIVNFAKCEWSIVNFAPQVNVGGEFLSEI